MRELKYGNRAQRRAAAKHAAPPEEAEDTMENVGRHIKTFLANVEEQIEFKLSSPPRDSRPDTHVLAVVSGFSILAPADLKKTQTLLTFVPRSLFVDQGMQIPDKQRELIVNAPPCGHWHIVGCLGRTMYYKCTQCLGAPAGLA